MQPPTQPALRTISVEFYLRPDLRWQCAFFEGDLSTRVGRMRQFASDDSLSDMLKCGNGWRDLADHQTLEKGMSHGRGRATMRLSPEQYRKLQG